MAENECMKNTILIYKSLLLTCSLCICMSVHHIYLCVCVCVFSEGGFIL